MSSSLKLPSFAAYGSIFAWFSGAKGRLALSLFWIFFCVFWPTASFAEDTTLGHLVCNIKENLKAYPHILNALSYIMGAFLLIRGLLLLKKHSEAPAQSPVSTPIAHLFGAGALMLLPSLAAVVQATVFGGGGGAGEFGCTPGKVSSDAASLDVMMQNFVTNLHGPIFILVSLISIAAGLTFIVSALLKGVKTGADARTADPKIIISHLIFGAILISTGTILPDTLASIFGSGKISSMTGIKLIQWSKITGSGVNPEAADKTVAAILAFVQIIGIISFLRGWLILKKAVEGGGQATLPQGFTHVIGGAMAINIDAMLKAIDATFGTGIINKT